MFLRMQLINMYVRSNYINIHKFNSKKDHLHHENEEKILYVSTCVKS